MKNLLLALSLVCALQGFAQEPTLYEYTWYLEDLIISGISNPPPLGKGGGVNLSFDENLPNDLNFRTRVCMFGDGEVVYDDPNSSFTFIQGLFIGGLICDLQIWLDYEALYFDFYQDEIDFPFVYNIIIIDTGDYILEIESESGNRAIYTNKFLAVNDKELVDVKIYPNPAKDIINLSALDNIDSVAIYNISGQRVISYLQGSSKISLDVSTLSTGMYIMKVLVGEQTGAYKIIKQ